MANPISASCNELVIRTRQTESPMCRVTGTRVSIPSPFATDRLLVYAVLCVDNYDFLFCVVELLFYVHGKHLRSCRDGQLT